MFPLRVGSTLRCAQQQHKQLTRRVARTRAAYTQRSCLHVLIICCTVWLLQVLCAHLNPVPAWASPKPERVLEFAQPDWQTQVYWHRDLSSAATTAYLLYRRVCVSEMQSFRRGMFTLRVKSVWCPAPGLSECRRCIIASAQQRVTEQCICLHHACPRARRKMCRHVCRSSSLDESGNDGIDINELAKWLSQEANRMKNSIDLTGNIAPRDAPSSPPPTPSPETSTPPQVTVYKPLRYVLVQRRLSSSMLHVSHGRGCDLELP
jgi:hypothetical protein